MILGHDGGHFIFVGERQHKHVQQRPVEKQKKSYKQKIFKEFLLPQ
jgi:hypothetical protein